MKDLYESILRVAGSKVQWNRCILVPEKYLLFQYRAKEEEEEIVDMPKISIEEKQILEESEISYEEFATWEKRGEGRYLLTLYNQDCQRIRGKMLLDQGWKNFRIILYPIKEVTRFSFDSEILDKLLFIVFQIRSLFAGGLYIHGAAIEYKGSGIIFSAPSGTGKTTQASLWKRYRDATIFNGDRPAITIRDGRVDVHGSPWSGKDEVYMDVHHPLKVLVILEQSPVNQLKELDVKDALMWVLPRIFMPYFDPELTCRALALVESLVKNVPVIKLSCRPDMEAVELLEEYMDGL